LTKAEGCGIIYLSGGEGANRPQKNKKSLKKLLTNQIGYGIITIPNKERERKLWT
jgi:hypothetical protein